MNRTGTWLVSEAFKGSETHFEAVSNYRNVNAQPRCIAVTYNMTSQSLTIRDNITAVTSIFVSINKTITKS